VLWPVVVRAQQSDRMRRIGVLLGGLAADDPEAQRGLAALRQGLAALGRIEGRDLQIDYRSGVGDTERSRKFAAELVANIPDIHIL
jgi:putative ABC transport system substrate-binding protein